ncbi:hypothetical protein [uncultured Corynebacterium sp.]|uniref:hypothetical protein n=1 Tax=uncultured Corynebacterium sp. TaxID=159447 RepID=UPI0028042EF0|nr:hypothetical protein [uncultured Corynebacterium sp.]
MTQLSGRMRGARENSWFLSSALYSNGISLAILKHSLKTTPASVLFSEISLKKRSTLRDLQENMQSGALIHAVGGYEHLLGGELPPIGGASRWWKIDATIWGQGKRHA